MRTLLIVSPEMARIPKPEQKRREEAGACPRALLLEEQLHADVLDGAYLRSLPRVRRLLYSRLPGWVAQTVEAFRVRRRYDVVVTWDDRVALLFALTLGATRSRTRHVALVSWMGPVKKGLMLRLVQKHIDRIVVWTHFHRDLLCELYGIAADRLAAVPYWVDDKFYAPLATQHDGICAVGDSKRDYGTLLDALHGLSIPCRIVTQARPSRIASADWGVTAGSLAGADRPGDRVTIGPAEPIALRDVYARSRFVVVPLFPSLRDHGITSVIEAMAMGKAVICTQTAGLAGVVEDGVSGILVPPGNPGALREAIRRLWEQPELAERMGAEGRRYVEQHYSLERFVAAVRHVVAGSTAQPSIHPTALEADLATDLAQIERTAASR